MGKAILERRPVCHVRIKDEMDKLGIEAFDGILSDAMSKTSGNQDIDHSSFFAR